ncbi:hypothetical protein MtrunA17_Chr4g0028091 [Medicago truncatula]|uniref:Uncharacterized protein n=1 Tax=Medicago truncatula TaxID=3880 RepID=A0A396I8S8_MEDTR|nr:hypothetical protein MtrunA17_Chr4g0028091 [Medicago truncatula]
MPHRRSLATCAFFENKMGSMTKNATKLIIEGQFCCVLKEYDHFRE